MKRFPGKTAIVTGGASGIGRDTCLRFAEEGAAVVVADIDVTQGEGVVSAICRRGGEAHFVEADVSTARGARLLVDAALAAFGAIDILVNNAGIEISGKIVDFPEASFDRLVDVNLKSVFLCSQLALRHMAPRRAGVIINLASVASFRPWPDDGIYSVTKAGVLSFTRALALEHAPDNIRVNAVAPAIIDTPMTDRAIAHIDDKLAAKQQKGAVHPLGRLGTPVEVANAILFLCSPEASFTTGACLTVDGGLLASSGAGGER